MRGRGEGDERRMTMRTMKKSSTESSESDEEDDDDDSAGRRYPIRRNRFKGSANVNKLFNDSPTGAEAETQVATVTGASTL